MNHDKKVHEEITNLTSEPLVYEWLMKPERRPRDFLIFLRRHSINNAKGSFACECLQVRISQENTAAAKRLEYLTWAIAGFTVVIAILTGVLVWKELH